jgi:hypothetical protein
MLGRVTLIAMVVSVAGCSSEKGTQGPAPVTLQTGLQVQRHRVPRDALNDDKDIVTIQGGRARLGWNPGEKDLTPSSVAAGGLALKWESPVFDSANVAVADGGTKTFGPRVLGSPLLVEDVDVPGMGDLSVVLAATGNGFIYAVSASPQKGKRPAPGTIVWSRQLNQPVSVNSDNWTIGVLGTPIVDLEAEPARVYVVSADAHLGWQLFALDLRDGSVLPGWPLTINDAAVGAVNQNGPSLLAFAPGVWATQRAALNLNLNRTLLYVGFAGLRDLAPGWMVTVDTRTASIASAFSSGPVTALTANGGVWAPTGPAVDDDGTLFATTGNSPNGDGPAAGVWGESLLAWGPGSVLQLQGTYTPFNYCNMELQDADLGGSGPLLIPDLDPETTSTPRLALFGSKQGNVYLVDRNHLPGGLFSRQACSLDSSTELSLLPPGPQPQFGKVGPLNVFGPYTESPVKVKSRMRTTGAYFVDSAGNHLVYVTGNTKQAADGNNNDVPPDVVRLKIVTTAGAPAYLAVDAVESTLPLVNPSSPVVTSHGTHDPLVWVIDAYGSDAEFNTPGIGFEHTRPVLYVIDGATMKPLWHTAVDELGEGGKYTIPVVKHGTAYVATDRVRAYGLP